MNFSSLHLCIVLLAHDTVDIVVVYGRCCTALFRFLFVCKAIHITQIRKFFLEYNIYSYAGHTVDRMLYVHYLLRKYFICNFIEKRGEKQKCWLFEQFQWVFNFLFRLFCLMAL